MSAVSAGVGACASSVCGLCGVVGVVSDDGVLLVPSLQCLPCSCQPLPQVDIMYQNSTDPVILNCSLRGYPLSALRWRKDGTPLDPDGSHITITTFRRQDPTDPYPFSSTTDSSFEPIPLEGLEYFEAVSELTLAPPLLLTDTADYTCEVEAEFVESITAISDNIPVIIIGEPLLTLFIQLLYLTVHCSLSHFNLP